MSIVNFPGIGEKTSPENDRQKRVGAILNELESEKGIRSLEATLEDIQGKGLAETLSEIIAAMDEAGATLEEQEDTIRKYLAFVRSLSERRGQKKRDDEPKEASANQ